MINRMLHNSLQHRLIGIIAASYFSRQICHWNVSNVLFKKVATLLPTAHKFVPGNRRLGPFLFRLPTRHRIVLRCIPNSFIPQQQVLKQLRNRMSPRRRSSRGNFRRNFCQQLRQRRSIPRVVDSDGVIFISDSSAVIHISPCMRVNRSGISGVVVYIGPRCVH